MKRKILILFLLSGIISISRCGKQIEPTNGKIFTIEYDHPESYDVLGGEQYKVERAFEQANTTVDFKYDDANLPDLLLRWIDLHNYYNTHVKRDSNGVIMYEGYLCGIKGICDTLGSLIDTVWGATYIYVGPYIGYSFICIGNPYLPGNCVVKTTIHELGHQRAGLTHLCLPDGTMNPMHNDSACVMGKGWVANCTSKDLC